MKALGLHLRRGRAPNAGSSLRNKRHLYSTPRSKHGWLDEREAGTKEIRCRRCLAPQPTISQNPGGGGLRGGASHTRTGPGRPPRDYELRVQWVVVWSTLCSSEMANF